MAQRQSNPVTLLRYWSLPPLNEDILFSRVAIGCRNSCRSTPDFESLLEAMLLDIPTGCIHKIALNLEDSANFAATCTSVCRILQPNTLLELRRPQFTSVFPQHVPQEVVKDIMAALRTTSRTGEAHAYSIFPHLLAKQIHVNENIFAAVLSQHCPHAGTRSRIGTVKPGRAPFASYKRIGRL